MPKLDSTFPKKERILKRRAPNWKIIRTVTKWSVVSIAMLMVAGTVMVIPKERRSQTTYDKADEIKMSQHELIKQLLEVNGDEFIVSKQAKDSEVKYDNVQETISTAGVVLKETANTVGRLLTDTTKVSKEISTGVQESAEWVVEYHDENLEEGEKICNHSATKDFVEPLLQQGVPAYLLSMCPKDVNQRLSKSWHQVAFVKLTTDLYVIKCCNNNIIFFKGSLEQYASSKDMIIAPIVGVAEKAPPFFDNFAARGLSHIVNSGIKPDEIPSLLSDDTRTFASNYNDQVMLMKQYTTKD